MVRFLVIFSKSMLLSLLFTEPMLFAAIILAIVVALTFHEFAHAAVASWLGDKTAERMGRMTLNPLVHLDPVGFLMLLMAGFGYARPVPYNPMFLQNKRRDPVLIGIAGPISNVIMATVFALLLKYLAVYLGPNNMLLQFLFFATLININLAIFNILPVPPLDGSKILLAILHDAKWAKVRHVIVTQGPFILIMLILADAFGGIGIFSRLFTLFGNAFFGLFNIYI
jgi:Zn-dependent protease